MEKHGKIRYRFMNAYLFATVFQKNQEALKDLIAALLRIELKEIVSLEILNPIQSCWDRILTTKAVLWIFWFF